MKVGSAKTQVSVPSPGLAFADALALRQRLPALLALMRTRKLGDSWVAPVSREQEKEKGEARPDPEQIESDRLGESHPADKPRRPFWGP